MFSEDGVSEEGALHVSEENEHSDWRQGIENANKMCVLICSGEEKSVWCGVAGYKSKALLTRWTYC